MGLVLLCDAYYVEAEIIDFLCFESSKPRLDRTFFWLCDIDWQVSNIELWFAAQNAVLQNC